MKYYISPPNTAQIRQNSKIQNGIAHNALVEFQVWKVLSCVNQKKAWKRHFLYSCIPLSLHLPLTSVPFCMTWLIWAWKITHDKSPVWLDLSLAVSLFRSLSSPCSFQPFLSHERQGLPIMPVYGSSREELFSCVTGVCVSVRLNRKCAALTDTMLFPLTGSGLLCLIQQRECLC